MKWALHEAQGYLTRHRVAPHKGVEQYGLSSYQVYPKGSNLNVDFLTEPHERCPKLIHKNTTHIASIGSCFAVEIRRYFREAGFNFVSTRESWAGSAEWGRVYTTKNMLQIFQYTFGEFQPEIRFCRKAERVFDPYRDNVWFASQAQAEESVAQHYRESRDALVSCDVLIMTPGQNEAWVDRNDGLAWATKPPAEAFARYGQDRFYVKRYSLRENVDCLSGALELLWEHNPGVAVILTVSPVPSSATFQDVNVGIRSFENKAILLLAVKEIVERHPQRVHYFPSFEMVLLSNNANFQLDNRHVRPRVVEEIMECFRRRFVANP